MKTMGTVYGNTEQAQALVVGKDTVYVHTDIVPVEENGEAVQGLFCYTEVQYGKDEYIALMAQQSDSLSAELTDTQLALCELYEAMGGAQ